MTYAIQFHRTKHHIVNCFNIPPGETPQTHQTDELDCVWGEADRGRYFMAQDADGNWAPALKTPEALAAGLYWEQPKYPEPIATKEQINEVAGALILARYPAWRQINIVADGGAEAEQMRDFRRAVVDASNELTTNPPPLSALADHPVWPKQENADG